MERLHEITSRPPETPHEVAFHEAYGKMIDMALDALQNPANPENPNASWLVFKQVQSVAYVIQAVIGQYVILHKTVT